MVCAGEYFGAKAEGYGVFEAAGGDACYGGWKAGVRNGYLSVHWPDGAIDYGRYNGLEDEWASRMHIAPSGERTFTEDDTLPVPFDGGNAGHIRLLHLAKEAEVPLHTQSVDSPVLPRAKLLRFPRRMLPRLPRGGRRCAVQRERKVLLTNVGACDTICGQRMRT